MRKIFCCLFAMGFILQCCAQNAPLMLDLNGNWKFNKGDDPKWAKADFNSDDWSELNLPSWDWGNEYTGYGWFKHDVMLPSKEIYFFNLGQVDDDCEVYFNGTLLKLYISSRPNKDNTDTAAWDQWKKYRAYYIPKELINTDKKNNISVRVWNTLGGQGGIRYGNIFISKTIFYNKLPIELEGSWMKTDGSNEFLVGFYNNKVVYKNLVWNYGAVKSDHSAITIELTANGKTEKLFVVKDSNSKNYLIGPDKSSTQLCSVKETFKLTSDTAAGHYIASVKQPGKATFSGFIKGYSSTMGNMAVIELRDQYNQSTTEKRMQVNEDGTFSVDIDADGPLMASFHLPGITAVTNPVVIEPNKVTVQVIDLEEFKIRITSEYYGRERLTMFMGDLPLENKLMTQMNWLSSLEDKDKKVWDKFIATARYYASTESAYDWQMNNIAGYIALNYKKYNDLEALKLAKVWSVKTLYAAPENHYYNSTLNVILTNLGENLEGLQYLVKALYSAEKENNQPFVDNYKQKIKVYIADMLK